MGLWPCDWCLSKNMGSLPSLSHHPALTSFPEDFQRASQYEWELPDGGIPGVFLEVDAPILKALCPGLHSVLLTFQALIGKKRLCGWRASQDSWCSRGLPSSVFLISPSAAQAWSFIHEVSMKHVPCPKSSAEPGQGNSVSWFFFFKPVNLLFIYFLLILFIYILYYIYFWLCWIFLAVQAFL